MMFNIVLIYVVCCLLFLGIEGLQQIFKIQRLARPNLMKLNLLPHPGGLLAGISNLTEGHFFSESISINATESFVQNQLFSTVVNNNNGNSTEIAEELALINSRAASFIGSRDIWDRTEIISALSEIVERKGKFVCLLAGKSTGKTLILRYMEEIFPTKVFVVDLRKNSDILTGLIEVLRSRQSSQNRLKSAVGDNLPILLRYGVEAALKVNPTGREIIEKNPELDSIANFLIKNPNPKSLQKTVISLSETLGGITLVIDEANIALSVDEQSPQATIESTRSALALFTALTKAENKLNVILVSSEHSYPFRLGDKRLRFKLENLNGHIFSGELPPKDMYELLTTRWSIKHDLALHLLSIYGGHIYDTYEVRPIIYTPIEVVITTFILTLID